MAWKDKRGLSGETESNDMQPWSTSYGDNIRNGISRFSPADVDRKQSERKPVIKQRDMKIYITIFTEVIYQNVFDYESGFNPVLFPARIEVGSWICRVM